MPKFDKVEEVNGRVTYLFFCPGCQEHHAIWTGAGSPSWTFNNDPDSPTCSPSLRVTMGPKPDPITHLAPKNAPRRLCHSFIKNGMIQFLGDCTHKLAGKTVEIPEVE